MANRPRILAIVLAGGEGKRLAPLTRERSKPAVPFGGRYRIVDFVLSNLVNSGIHAIYLLVQYKSQSLIQHIQRAWVLAPIFPEQFVTVVPPQMQHGQEWFQGTANAVFQNLNLIEHHRPDIVAVFGADHVYRMDVRQMADFHLEHDADVTVAALPIPRAAARAFGVIDAAPDGRIRSFLEKPENPAAMPHDPRRSYASMGNYLFRARTLIEELKRASVSDRREKDFGRDVLPRLVNAHRMYAYDFAQNRVPGVRPSEEQAYWRDVGTLDAYFAAHQDTLGAEPRFNLFSPQWRIASRNYQGPASRLVHAEIDNCIIGAGGLIKSAKLRNSIVRQDVRIEEDVEIEDCIVMDYCAIGRGARLKRVIIDRYNTISSGERVGFDLDADRRVYHVTDSGIVVIAKGEHTLSAEHGYADRYL